MKEERFLIKTILIDDEKAALNNLERFLKGYDQIEILGAYTDETKALEEIKNKRVNLIFLDIEMPKMKGIEVAKKILEIDSNIQIIFVTAYNDYAIDAFDLEALDYVMKPIIKKRFDKTMERVMKRCSYFFQEKELDEECKILCFRNFEIIGKQVIKWRTSKAEEFIAYLVHHRGAFVHKSKIIEDLWPGKDEEQAIKLLHTNVYYARIALKSNNLDQLIIYYNKMYKFHIGKIFCDMEEFYKAFHINKVITNNNVCIMEKIIQIYKGGYLESNDYHWAINEQLHFNKMYIDILIKISDFYINEGKNVEAIYYLKKILEKDPYIEEVHQKLMNIYINIGDYINFKKHYKTVYNNFKLELDVELSDKMKELYKEGILKLKYKI